MPSIRFLLVLLILALPQWAQAQQQPLLRAAARHVPLPTFETVDYKIQCPSGYVPNGYSATPQYPFDVNEDEFRLFVDRNGVTVDKSSLTSAAALDGGGYSLEVYNVEHHDKNLQALAFCLALSASSDNALTIVSATGTVARGAFGTVNVFCPAESPVAFGGFTNVDAISMQDYGGSPLWGTSASPTVLSSLADGTTMGPPTGWQSRVINQFSNNAVTAYAFCGQAPSMKVFVSTVTAPGAQFGLPTAFTIYAPVPEGWTAVGSGYDGGSTAPYLASDAWTEDGTVVSLQQWYDHSTTYESGSAQIRAFMVRAHGNGAGGGRAAVAILALPQAASPPPSIVPIVEFYDAALDHYFVTANADEIAKLDNGTFKGWARTGETFNAYAAGSPARSASRRPVCREYGNPLYGLDSHFYSASPDECGASMVTTSGSWILEATEVFQMDLPDATGACPAGGVPVYRIWNKRRDSNHRYTTKIAIRDQMVAKGGVAEGYGPNAVALCGSP